LRAETIRANLAEVRERVGSGVQVLVATKYVSVDELEVLREAGVTLVGENRTDALVAKQARFADAFTWDFIGHVQSRKARDVIGRVRLVHAVDSISVCEQFQQRAQRPVDCLLQVDVAGEETKAGLAPVAVDAFLEQIEPLDRVHLRGLMTMPPLAADAERVRPHFAALRELRDRLEPRWRGRHAFAELSMGTSQDYAVAAQEGATIVRVGSVLFGDRRG
jgi:pyridoxal phosphate enzyme (YggS family)